MNTTTTNSMNFLGQLNDGKINAAVPQAMRDCIQRQAKKRNMTESGYIKLALQNQLDRDLNS